MMGSQSWLVNLSLRFTNFLQPIQTTLFTLATTDLG